MIEGCSNHNCAVKGKTPGMHTNGICGCVDFKVRENEAAIEINNQKVGPTFTFSTGDNYYEAIRKLQNIREWLRDGGLHDILKLAETKRQNR